MVSRPKHLRLVAAERGKIAAAPAPAWGDLALLVTLAGVNVVPLAGVALGIGRWGGKTVGLATACALLCGRELWLEARAPWSPEVRS